MYTDAIREIASANFSCTLEYIASSHNVLGMENKMGVFIEKEVVPDLGFDEEALIRKVIPFTEEYMHFPYETEINVILTDDEGIRKVNQECRQVDAPTDVLSFPMLEYEAAGDFSGIDEEDDFLFNPDTGALLLGDMMLSVERIKAQAAEYGHSPERELAFLVVHSMLHLFGYDHMEEEERNVMEEKQRDILAALHITR